MKKIKYVGNIGEVIFNDYNISLKQGELVEVPEELADALKNNKDYEIGKKVK